MSNDLLVNAAQVTGGAVAVAVVFFLLRTIASYALWRHERHETTRHEGGPGSPN